MAILRKACLAFLGLLCHISASAFLSAQYCHSLKVKESVPFCVAAITTYNTTTQGIDLSVTFAYQKSLHGGWGAIGLGDGMYGALMFVTYGEDSEKDGKLFRLIASWSSTSRNTLWLIDISSDLVLSVRAGK